ncbi:MAG TPA: hypothetical protein VJS66_09650 [Burkholderiales bacterium]|nr:hypothetical protein [Burkholderiales bacterium]
MAMMLRGVLVEYGSDFLGPLPNIVVFQFNPEQIARTINIPQRPSSGGGRAARTPAPRNASAPPTESFTLTAHFSAADDLGRGGALSVIPRAAGIGPQIYALEKMAQPSNILGGLLGAAIDAVGSALGGGGEEEEPTRPTPPEKLPRILFIWGPWRVLPVQIKSLSVTEQKFDFLLNPVQAEVQIGLDVVNFGTSTDDKLGKGALDYTKGVREAQAALNLVKAVELALDIVPF